MCACLWDAAADRRPAALGALLLLSACLLLLQRGATPVTGLSSMFGASALPTSAPICLSPAALQRLVPPDTAGAGACCVGTGPSAMCWRAPDDTAGAAAAAAPRRRLRVLFMSNQLGDRGTEVALYDYADAFERAACGVAWVAAPASRTSPSVRAKFEARFPGRVLGLAGGCNADAASDGAACTAAVARALAMARARIVYAIDYGTRLFWAPPPDAIVLVHGVFDGRDAPWPGDVRAAVISDSVRRAPGVAVVPHIVPPLPPAPAAAASLRAELGIAAGATVFCRHGGTGTFDVPAARAAVCMYARRQAAAGGAGYVLLLNTAPADCDAGASRIVHLPAVVSLEDKARFLAACDACVHGRLHGETFGLAVAECAVAGLPVLASAHADADQDFHLRTLGAHARLYDSPDSLLELMERFDVADARAHAGDYARIYAEFAPPSVMLTFLRAFGILDDVIVGEPAHDERL